MLETEEYISRQLENEIVTITEKPIIFYKELDFPLEEHHLRLEAQPLKVHRMKQRRYIIKVFFQRIFNFFSFFLWACQLQAIFFIICFSVYCGFTVLFWLVSISSCLLFLMVVLMILPRLPLPEKLQEKMKTLNNVWKEKLKRRYRSSHQIDVQIGM